MFVISAYAPPTFSKPVLVWQTCECHEGIHMMGCWVEALHCDHAMKMLGQALADAHSQPGKNWFEIGRFPNIYTALEVHVKMAMDMQNGRGQELWEAGYEPYLKFWEKFKNHPIYGAE
jgi:hypothetical protein